MTQSALKDTLRSMVYRYGFEQVNECLREIGLSDPRSEGSDQVERASQISALAKPGNRRSKVTAPGHVAKMKLPSEKEAAVSELAKRFEDKAFLPTFGDIANFCQIYGIDEPASKSRASAIPRVFTLIAAMEADDIQRILDDGMFSGPSRLGPIADAIRRNGRASRKATQNVVKR